MTHDHRVTLSKIGSVKMVYHRPLKGTMKTCTIHRSSTGKWYVSFSVECEPERLAPIDTQVGIDVGLKTFATLSTGEEIAPRLAKSIQDAAWSHFFDRLSSKAEETGRTFVKVNPAYTSQECSRNPVWGTGIHHRQKMPLHEHTYHCPCCLLVIDRDLNAALNIKAVGLHSVGWPLEAPAAEAWGVVTNTNDGWLCISFFSIPLVASLFRQGSNAYDRFSSPERFSFVMLRCAQHDKASLRVTKIL